MSFGEPWRVIRDATGDQIKRTDGQTLCVDFQSHHSLRAVACVNALAGLDPEAVKRVVEAAQTIRASNAEWLSRCDYCGWPIADSVESGCTPDNCSMRPRPKPADADIKQGLRRLLDALASLERGKEDK